MPSEIIICVALCMFMDGKLVEHTYQKSMGECLKNKRIAERTIQPERVQFACGNDIEALEKAVLKLQSDVEKLKDKQRSFGNGGQ